MIQAIVFDFDGVIVDSEPLHYRAFLPVFDRLGLTVTYADYLKDYVGFDDRDAIEFAHRRAGRPVDPGSIPRMIADKGDAFAEVVAAGVEAIDGAVAFIEHAAERIPIAIASGALRSDIDLILPRIGDSLAERFSAIVTADDVERSKPDPQTYALAAERLGIAADKCLAIEDTAAGLVSARSAHLRTLGVTNTHAADLLTDAERVIDALAGLTIDQLRQWYGE